MRAAAIWKECKQQHVCLGTGTVDFLQQSSESQEASVSFGILHIVTDGFLV